MPFQITFKNQSRWQSRIAELRIDAEEERHLSLPISGTLTSADGRTVTMQTLE